MERIADNLNYADLSSKFQKLLGWKAHPVILRELVIQFVNNTKNPVVDDMMKTNLRRMGKFDFSSRSANEINCEIQIYFYKGKFVKRFDLSIVFPRFLCEDHGFDVVIGDIKEFVRLCSISLGCRVSEPKFCGWLETVFERNRMCENPLPVYCTEICFVKHPLKFQSEATITFKQRPFGRIFKLPVETIRRFEMEDLEWEVD